MRAGLAVAVGYVLGTQARREDLDRLGDALAALRGSQELADVVAAARAHVGHALRGLADAVDGGEQPGDDLVGRVRSMLSAE